LTIQNFALDSDYPDAPNLASKLLIPALDSGKQITMVSAFAPSYVFGVVRELAARKSPTDGYLQVTFFVKGDLRLKSEGIARFKNYLSRFAENEVQVAQFVEDCLTLLTSDASKSFELKLLHSDQKKSPTKSLFGVIHDEESWPDMVTFIDAKAGDFNSPVVPKRTWVNEEYLESLDTYTRVNSLVTGEKGLLVGEQEVVSWLEYLSEWYESNPPVIDDDDDDDDDDEEDLDDNQILDVESSLIEFLQDFGEFQKEDQFEYDDSNFEALDWDDWDGGWAEVFASEAINGHIPPITSHFNALTIGVAKSVCVCGQVFTRVHGCPKVDW
jgi:hypothetical protein